MSRDRLLQMVRTLYRLTPEQMSQVEDFIVALDPELTLGQLDAVWLYVAALVSECDQRDTG